MVDKDKVKQQQANIAPFSENDIVYLYIPGDPGKARNVLKKRHAKQGGSICSSLPLSS